MKHFPLVVALAFPITLPYAEDTTEQTDTTDTASINVDPLEALRDEIEQLSTESRLRELQLKEEFADKIVETQRLKIEADHQRAEAQAELAEMQKERQAIEAELSLNASKTKMELAELEAKNKRLELEIDALKNESQLAIAEIRAEAEVLAAKHHLGEEKAKAELAAMAIQHKKLMAEVEMINVANNRQEAELKSDQLEIQSEALRLDLRRKELLAANDASNLELTQLKRQLEIREQAAKLRDSLDIEESYEATPFDGSTLTVSDRRIALNGPIIRGTADFVTERIHFFNNQDSEAPLFIVIDTCPGGSVREGYRILKAMEASDAPVHVVVKSFAASMAAVILTMAEHSYAFPNAVILHHQPFSFSVGNLTQQNEQMEIFNQWAERLHQPVADKMGVSLEDFYTQMYENNSDGDWQEFADVAQELKWVDNIIEELREEGIRRRPGSEAPQPFIIFAGTDADTAAAQVKSQVPQNAYIPTPGPFDFYFLYNRNGFYRWPSL